MSRELYQPMLLRDTPTMPEGDDWIVEPKLDGNRTIADSGFLLTRTGGNDADRYPAVVQQLPAALQGHSAVLDGEMIGYGPDGKPDFWALQRRGRRVAFMVFDILALDGEPLTASQTSSVPLAERYQILDGLLEEQEAVKRMPRYDDARTMLADPYIQDLRPEGPVFKRPESLYWPGSRSKQWLRLILHRYH